MTEISHFFGDAWILFIDGTQLDVSLARISPAGVFCRLGTNWHGVAEGSEVFFPSVNIRAVEKRSSW